MAVFSFVKRARQQAKDHKTREAEKAKDSAAKEPYKHVPTHAAIDAMMGAPSSSRLDDRPRIMEQNRRRSAMAASGHTLSDYPRVGSSLSYVSYPSAYATPIVPLPRNYSFSSTPSTWHDKVGSVYQQGDYFSSASSLKGKEVVAAPTLPPTVGGFKTDSGRASIRSNHVGSLSALSGNSSSSDEDLELKPSNHFGTTDKEAESRITTSREDSTQSSVAHRLHPAHSRYPPMSRSAHFAAPPPKNPRTVTGGLSIPPVPVLPSSLAPDHTLSPSTSVTVSSASSTASMSKAASTGPSSISSTPMHSTAAFIPSPTQPEVKPKKGVTKTTRFTELEVDLGASEDIPQPSADPPTPSIVAPTPVTPRSQQPPQEPSVQDLEVPAPKGKRKLRKKNLR